MNAPEWSRVKTILDAALDEPAARRAALLDTACAGDTELRREVESLLAEAEAPDCALEQHVQRAECHGEPWPGGLGGRFGHYALVRELGRGGMGAVFLATRADGQFRQDVAIKVIRRTIAHDALEPRFRRERQILASLNHPGIARLLDGGISDTGEPFLVMEYVNGTPLLAFVEQHALDCRGRLALFLKVCAAVAYAHGKLVVHRDLKPSNILVSESGEPKLLDFGLAKMLDEALPNDDAHTVPGFLPFTPSYAAPEQIQGDPVTTAGDVYSLGVVLFELLSGVKPFDMDRLSIPAMLRTLDTVAADRPSTAAARRPGAAPRHPSTPPPSALEGDLDTIVLTALRRDPEQRYQGVQALADDIDRHLQGLPVRARPQTWSYRAAKFVVRHRVAVAATVVMTTALVLALGLALWQGARARDERDRAARRFNDVRRLANALLFELGPRIERLHGATDARRLLLDKAVSYLDGLAAEADDDADLRLELASAYEKVGDLQGNPTNPNLVAPAAAIASYQKAQRLRLKTEDEGRLRFGDRRALAENHRLLGSAYAQANEFESAARELAVALASHEQLVAERPDDAELRGRLARVSHDIGRNESNTKRYAGSFPHFTRAISVAREVLRRRPEALDVLALLADSHAQYGLALSWEGRQREAEAQMGVAAGLYEPAVRVRPDDVMLSSGLWSTYWLTSSVYEEQDDASSHAYALKALEVARRTVRRDPVNERARQQLARSLSRLGQTATNTGQSREALSFLTEASATLRDISAGESKSGRLRSDLALALTRLAQAKAADGQLKSALTDAREAATVYAAVTAEQGADKRSWRNLVLTYDLIGDIHQKLARGLTGGASLAEHRRAQAGYQEALSLLLRLESGGGLADADRDFLDAIRQKLAAPRTASSTPPVFRR